MRTFVLWALAGAAIPAVFTLVYWLAGRLRFQQGRPTERTGTYWVADPLIMLPVVLAEEWVFRRWLIGATVPHIGVWWAIALSAVAFALVHVPNGVPTVWTPVNLALFSVVTGRIYLQAGLLAAFAFHWGCNVMQFPVLGYTAYGGKPVGRFMQTSIEGPLWLTGGPGGPESSIAETTLLVVAILLV
ncbi:MAG TPA: CPBP family intramembrane glutamic endopeptidase [Symbiobacteriaceae bacterium]|jgi:membrane protease YdiL (CAAX protease family)|nr:CPBP family intramembrane glutamic endopeptidase [Symbiobacteriaceae bacterium]